MVHALLPPHPPMYMGPFFWASVFLSTICLFSRVPQWSHLFVRKKGHYSQPRRDGPCHRIYHGNVIQSLGNSHISSVVPNDIFFSFQSCMLAILSPRLFPRDSVSLLPSPFFCFDLFWWHCRISLVTHKYTDQCPAWWVFHKLDTTMPLVSVKMEDELQEPPQPFIQLGTSGSQRNGTSLWPCFHPCSSRVVTGSCLFKQDVGSVAICWDPNQGKHLA